MKRFSSILFLSLLFCNTLGFTLVTFWNEWQENHRVKPSSFVEVRGNELIFKMQLTLPYQSEFRTDIMNGNTAIYEGKFYQSYVQVYQKDTLYTHYHLLNVSRDNVLALLNEVHENLNSFSKEHKTPSQKALDFLKNFSKDYVELHSKMITWFWIEDLGFENYNYLTLHPNFILSVNAPPPMLS
ncbi:MAG: hypothetical protein MUF45_00325 [Spirosomaceae bacterium]|nr:hypothetical protein [Spirosomataceae bacterium]